MLQLKVNDTYRLDNDYELTLGESFDSKLGIYVIYVRLKNIVTKKYYQINKSIFSTKRASYKLNTDDGKELGINIIPDLFDSYSEVLVYFH